MDAESWLTSELASFGCAACGQAYGEGHIRLIAQREELYFVDLSCDHCGSQAVASLHLARTVCPRPPRLAPAVDRVEPGIVPFLNLSSHALFVLARYLNARRGLEDPQWRPKNG